MKKGFTLAEGATHIKKVTLNLIQGLSMPIKFPFREESTLIDSVSRHGMTKTLGFTLAEVLITLGIIGVVAVMTIPNLVATHKAKRLRSQFLKSYSTIQQVFKRMEADDVSLDPSTYPTGTFYKTFGQYLQAARYCYRNASDAQCFSGSSSGKQYKSFDGKSTVAYNWFDDGQIALQDGTLIMFENYTSVRQLWVSVDLNGFNNPPNRWGYDLFTFEFLDGELRTMGDIQTKYNDLDKYCNPKGSSALNGIACAYKAKTNTDYFKWVVKNLK